MRTPRWVPRHRHGALLRTTNTLPFLSRYYNNDVSSPRPRPLALVVGVANQRSIAWAVVQSLTMRHGMDVIITYQNARVAGTIDKLRTKHDQTTSSDGGRIVHAFECDVQTGLPALFDCVAEQLAPHPTKLTALLHSVAFANMKDTSLAAATAAAFVEAQHVSAYSLLEMARCAHERDLLLPHNNGSGAGNDSSSSMSSLTTLSYLGAVRAVPHYHIMGPAKASLEALVRALALEYGPRLRVNAVSAGPLPTLAAMGGIAHFRTLASHVAATCPLRRSVTAAEVADTVAFLATAGTGITGQTIYVDGGYSVVGAGILVNDAT